MFHSCLNLFSICNKKQEDSLRLIQHKFKNDALKENIFLNYQT